MALSDTQRSDASVVRLDPEPPAIRTGLPAAQPRHLLEWRVALQFVQFCLVGAFSTALNVGLLNLFMSFGWGVIPSHVLSFSLAVTNGFFMNRAWTFRESRGRQMHRQYVMFVLVNLVGLGLSLLIVLIVGRWMLRTGSAVSLAGLFRTLTGRHAVPKQLAYSLGELAATPLCAIWNFSANKLWTFSASPAEDVMI